MSSFHDILEGIQCFLKSVGKRRSLPVFGCLTARVPLFPPPDDGLSAYSKMQPSLSRNLLNQSLASSLKTQPCPRDLHTSTDTFLRLQKLSLKINGTKKRSCSETLERFSSAQVRSYVAKLVHLYIAENTHLFSIFF